MPRYAASSYEYFGRDLEHAGMTGWRGLCWSADNLESVYQSLGFTTSL